MTYYMTRRPFHPSTLSGEVTLLANGDYYVTTTGEDAETGEDVVFASTYSHNDEMGWVEISAETLPLSYAY